jgi:hypothetical protein
MHACTGKTAAQGTQLTGNDRPAADAKIQCCELVQVYLYSVCCVSYSTQIRLLRAG